MKIEIWQCYNRCFVVNTLHLLQVAAQTGHKVTLVDLDQNILDQSTTRISKSLARVAKKKFGDDADGAKAFMENTMGAISTATDACQFILFIIGLN